MSTPPKDNPDESKKSPSNTTFCCRKTCLEAIIVTVLIAVTILLILILIAVLFDKNKLYCFLTDSQCNKTAPNETDFITNDV